MTPLQFIISIGDDYNSPVGAVVEALEKPLIIDGGTCYYEALSYYYDEDRKQMVLDIQEIKQ